MFCILNLNFYRLFFTPVRNNPMGNKVLRTVYFKFKIYFCVIPPLRLCFNIVLKPIKYLKLLFNLKILFQTFRELSTTHASFKCYADNRHLCKLPVIFGFRGPQNVTLDIFNKNFVPKIRPQVNNGFFYCIICVRESKNR